MRSVESYKQAGILGGQVTKEKLLKLKEEKIVEYNKHPKHCKQCKCVIPFEKKFSIKFCSRKCSYLYRKDDFIKRNTKHGDYGLKPCLTCGQKTKNKKFCSFDCDKEFSKKVRLEKLNDPKNSFNRRAVIELKGHKCQSCNLEKWKLFGEEKEINLTVHHIDGDSKNNSIDNLQVLCWNCHSMTPNYGRKNKNSTRINRL